MIYSRFVVASMFMAVLAFSESLIQAQGTLYTSNLDLPVTGQMAAAGDSWLAQSFKTGNESAGYWLRTVQLRTAPGSGNASGFEVLVLNSTGLKPAGVIGKLSGPDPIGGGVYSYTTTGVPLTSSSFYFLAIKGETPASAGQYSWSASRSGSIGTDGWGIDLYRYSSADGVTWNRESRVDSFQLAIYATPVPEPSVMVLAGLGLGALWIGRRRRF